jgi:hypothetical protein
MDNEKFRLEIKLGNSAMRDPEDVAIALELAAERIRKGVCYGQTVSMLDRNGSTVGSFTWPKAGY